MFGLGLAHHPADENIEQFLAGRNGPFGRIENLDVVLDELPDQIDRLIKLRQELRWPLWYDWPWWHWPWPWPPLPPFFHTCQCAPLYEPAWWNDAGQRQFNNNCYNYATNTRTDTFAQPGLAAGAEYATLSCPDVTAGAVADELIDSPTADNHCPNEGHLVALVVAPNYDFHWYRKGRDGYWTHKPGSTPATNVDNAGNLITRPENR